MPKNKIKYGLKNVAVAVQTYDGSEYSYGTPVSVPGAVNMSLNAEGSNDPFYADDIVYYRSVSNNGYTGTLELALITDWFRQNILKETADSNGVLVERSDDSDPVYFALLFEFAGDVKKIRHVMYNCSVSRPTIESSTKENNITPGTETLDLTCDPREDGLVKARTGDDTSTTTYSNWFNSVYEPATEDATLSVLTIGSVSLSPSFSSGVTEYTATTSNATNTITATANDTNAGVVIVVNGNSISSGESVTWATGTNTVAVTVTNGSASKTYTVTVTKS